MSFTIEPCVLVRERIKVDRGVTYNRVDISKSHNDDGSEDATWQTDRHFKNRTEAKEAEKIYHQVRNKIRSVCVHTDIGFICPISRKSDLEATIAECRSIVEDFNSEATCCSVNFLVVCTDILPSNMDGVEILRDAVERSAVTIRKALNDFNVKAIRDALNATKNTAEVIADPSMKENLKNSREEIRKLCIEMTALVKEFDGNVQNALASEKGATLQNRANAAWNF